VPSGHEASAVIEFHRRLRLFLPVQTHVHTRAALRSSLERTFKKERAAPCLVGFPKVSSLCMESRMTFRQFTLPLATLVALSADALGQEAVRRSAGSDDGQLVFNNTCRTCHALSEDDNRLGPNLHKIIGRRAGSLANYGYSSAMKGADLVWDKATLDHFIANPGQVVSGNNMKPHGGLASADERAKIIAFLEAKSGN